MLVSTVIQHSLERNSAQPTMVLNTLVELENTGGMAALFELKHRLAALYMSHSLSNSDCVALLGAWGRSVAAYIDTFCPFSDAFRADHPNADAVDLGDYVEWREDVARAETPDALTLEDLEKLGGGEVL